MEQKLVYRNGASRFSEALPVGNGSLGAMVYGSFPCFHYSLNADTLWSGRPGQKKQVKVREEDRKKLREYLSRGNYEAAQNIVQNKMTGEQYSESYLGAGNLYLKFLCASKKSKIVRELDFYTACVKTEIYKDDGNIKIESFASGEDRILITQLTAERPVSLEIFAESKLRFYSRAEAGELELCAEAPSHVEPNYVESEEPVVYGGGMKFSLLTKIRCNGETAVGKDRIRVTDATKLSLYTVITTGFRGYDRPLEKSMERLREEGRKILQSALVYQDEELKARHIKGYQKLFQRVTFQLAATVPDASLYERLFQYGRYLMIASSQPGGSYSQPANLQGLWCEDVRSVWSSNFTVNINTEMNYWLTGPCALSECDGPLIEMIREISAEGEKTAQDTWGCGGFAACHNIDLWRQTAPVKGEAKWAYWPMGGVWLATHLYQHYLYTNDGDFLREKAYPVMKKAAVFCMDFMYQEEGQWFTFPNTSPENTFLDEAGRVCCISRSVTMDQALMREIMTNTLDAGKILMEAPDFLEKLQTAISRLREYQEGEDGQLLEWDRDYKEVDIHHRHFAHLAGFHPFHQIDFDTRAELLPAVKRVLERRTEGMALKIGWNEGWLVNFYARLGDGEKAREHLETFWKDCTYPNLLGLHPPLGESAGEKEIFQIDGNFGITAGISEMLMQAKPGHIRLLPALPGLWEEGEINGLIAPGKHRVCMSWKKGRLKEAAVQTEKKETLQIYSRHPFWIFCAEGKRSRSFWNGSMYQGELKAEEKALFKIFAVNEDEERTDDFHTG